MKKRRSIMTGETSTTGGVDLGAVVLSALILRRARYAPVSKDGAAPCFETRSCGALLIAEE